MKKQTMIYTVLCGLMMSSASIASNDEFTTPEKSEITRKISILTPYTAEVVKEQLEADLRQKKQIQQAQSRALIVRDLLLAEARKKEEEDAEKHKTEIKKLEDKLTTLNFSTAKTEQELIELRQENEALKKDKQVLEMKEKEIQAEIAKKALELQTLETEHKTQNDELVAAKAATAKDVETIAELQKGVDSRERAIKALKEVLNTKRKEQLEVNDQLVEKVKEEGKLQAKYIEVEAVLARTKEELSTVKKHIPELGDAQKSPSTSGTSSSSSAPAVSRKNILPVAKK